MSSSRYPGALSGHLSERGGTKSLKQSRDVLRAAGDSVLPAACRPHRTLSDLDEELAATVQEVDRLKRLLLRASERGTPLPYEDAPALHDALDLAMARLIRLQARSTGARRSTT